MPMSETKASLVQFLAERLDMAREAYTEDPNLAYPVTGVFWQEGDGEIGVRLGEQGFVIKVEVR